MGIAYAKSAPARWLQRPSAGNTVDMVLVRGEFRQVGAITQEELEELERAHDAGDARAEDTLRLIRTGRRP